MAALVIRAVVFDLFGTLVHEFPRSDWDAWLAVSAAAMEADPEAFRRAWEATAVERQTGRLGDIEENLRTVAARAGAWPTDGQLAEALEARAGLFRRWFVPRPGAGEILAELRARGMPTALVSMCAPDTPALWRASSLAEAVDVEVFSCEVGLRKPDAEIYLLACDRLGVEPSACLYVGDGSYRELTGASRVGMRAVLVRDPAESGADVLRPDADDWRGERVGHLSEVLGLLAAAP
ncbi:MAG TPA: HAD-IA family hydrolase [Actinomycetota bacterium]